MKKKNKQTRKLRKCEKGIRTKSNNHGCRYYMSETGNLIPFLPKK